MGSEARESNVFIVRTLTSSEKAWPGMGPSLNIVLQSCVTKLIEIIVNSDLIPHLEWLEPRDQATACPQTNAVGTLESHFTLQVIGKNNVAVPTHLYKIILAEEAETSSPPMLGVFIIPNQSIGDVGLTQFQVSLEDVESHTGTKFHGKLDRSKV